MFPKWHLLGRRAGRMGVSLAFAAVLVGTGLALGNDGSSAAVQYNASAGGGGRVISVDVFLPNVDLR